LCGAYSSGSAGYGNTTGISFAGWSTVDNSLYSYAISLSIPSTTPSSNLLFYAVTIGFAYPT
jgi:hypothetical protein